MKKIISLLLVISMVLSLSPVVFAETVEIKSDSESIGLLNALGITEETNPDLKITRADFSKMLLKVIGFEAVSEFVFSDVAKDYEASGAIYTLYNMKLINGKGDGKFFPEDEMTIEETITVLLRFSGYEELANYQGGYPTGYTFVANDVNLTKGVSYKIGETLTLAKAAKLFENLFEVSLFSIVMVSLDGTVYRQATENKTVASVYLKMDIVEDIVTANRHTSLYTALDSSERFINLGRTKYKSNKFDTDSYLGFSVKAYIDSETEEVLYLKKSERNKVLFFNSNDFDDISNNRIYYNDGKDYEEIPATAPIIYNNKAITDFSDTYFDIKKGSIELIDNNNDNEFDVIKIISYKNYVVDSVSSDGSIIRLKHGMGVIDLKDKYKNHKVYDIDGMEGPVEMINGNSVLTVLENAESGYIEIIYQENYASGTVTGVENGEEAIIYIDNQPYVLSDYFVTNQSEFMRTAISGIFFLDTFGEIIFYLPTVGENQGYAYLLNIAERERESEEISVKLFTQTGEEKFLESGKYVTLDGVRGSALTALDTLTKNGFTPQLIYYECNSKGQINNIDTVKPDAEGSEIEFKELYDSEDSVHVYRSESMTLDSDDDLVYVSPSCVVFSVPKSLTSNAEDYVVSDKSELSNGANYSYKAYTRSKNGVEADVVVLPTVEKKVTFSPYSYICVMERITEAVNEDGEKCHRLSYWCAGKQFSRFTTDAELIKHQINPGDVLLISVLDGEIRDYRYLYNYREGKVDDAVAGRSMTSGFRFTCGYGYDIINSNLFRLNVDYTDGTTGIEMRRPAKFIYNVLELPGGNVKIQAGTLNDLRDSASFGLNNCSKVFSHQVYLADYGLVIYNKI